MTQEELNALPEKLYSGKLSHKKAMDEICKYVIENYPLYGLHKHDEDFKQEILLELVERGHHIFRLYKPDYGDFFTFLYCYICTLINSCYKKQACATLKEKITMEDSLDTLSEKEFKYHRIDFDNFDLPKIPYAPKRIPPEEIQQTLRELSLKRNDKKILVLALKSSYYLTDEQIDRICKLYKIKPEYFISMIQHCKDSMLKKTERRERAMERRNFAYYHHRRYNQILYNIEEDYSLNKPEYLLAEYEYKEKKHRKSWNRLNEAFENGLLYMRPTNKTVASLMGICERQVNYYINCARREVRKNSGSASLKQ